MADIFEDNSWVLPYRSPWATAVFYVLTQVGNLEVLVLLLPVAYWMLRQRFFTRFILLLLFTVTFDALLKDVLQDPRPNPANIIGDRLIGTYSFPSDHVTLATAYWSLLAFELQRRWSQLPRLQSLSPSEPAASIWACTISTIFHPASPSAG